MRVWTSLYINQDRFVLVRLAGGRGMKLIWDEYGPTVLGGGLIVFALVTALITMVYCVIAAENYEEYIGPVNGCVRYEHHDNRLFSEDRVDSVKTYCEAER